jgi:hypothetical protein
MTAEQPTAESPDVEAPVPEGDPDMPAEGQPSEGEPPTAPENPDIDPERVEQGEEDLDKVGN